MKRFIYMQSLVLVMLALAVATMTAANVDSRDAQARAIQFMNRLPGIRMMASNANLKLTHAEKSAVNAKANDYYVFNYDGGGYIIVSGDDRAEEILGYGSGRMDVNNLPVNVAWWLNQYKQQMEWLIANPDAQVETPSQTLSTMLTATTVPTLMTSQWDQEEPYYNQCPKYNGSYCMTGCVATAMAQVMYYWKYPSELPALPAYTTAETPKFNVPALPGTTLDWDNMLDNYSTTNYNTTQANAVAWLMRYCGQAVKMMYSPDGSGAYTEDARDAMVQFGYSTDATVKYRDDHSATEWHALMQAELVAGRPILYGGNDYSAGGHEFVVDGYNASTNKYHVNFGWSGYDDNYYALDAFKGSGYTFNYYQDMIIGVYPTSTLQTYAPVMTDASGVGTTSFKATWTDQTASENVEDYTLYVQQYDANQETLLTETFAGADGGYDGSADIANNLDNYCDNKGWTGAYVYVGAGGSLRLGNSSYAGSLTTPALDMSNSKGTITVKFRGRYYSSDNSSVVVSCGNATQTVALNGVMSDFTVVLNGVEAVAGQKVTFACTAKKKRLYIDDIEIVTGDASSMLRATESGDAESRVITGITSKNYTVSGLTEGGSYKFYVEANYTDGSTKKSNVKTVTLGGTLQPTPEVIVDPETLTMTANAGETATATFDVLAADLTGNVTLTLNDENGVYRINPSTLSIADAEEGATVTVTYAPTAAGSHDATITVASEGAKAATVTLKGTVTMQTAAPVMAAATNVGTTSFTATWTDATPAQNVKDYTLYVNKAGAMGDALLTETFAGVNVTKDGTYDRGQSMDDYCDNAGWTGSAAYEAATGGFKLGSGSKVGYITTPALAANNGTLVVAINANSYVNTNGNSDESSIVISCGEVSQTIALADDATDYTVTLAGVNAAAGQQVTLSCTAAGKRVYVHQVAIYNGGNLLREASETGDANSRVITGITDKTYTVENLTAGATYTYYVVANYTDGTNAKSNVEQVALTKEIVPEVIVDPETLTMTAGIGETVTATFDVLAANLTGNVTLTLNDENGVYSINPSTISMADAEEGGDLLLIDKSLTPHDGDIAVCFLDGDFTVKRIALRGKQLLLKPANVEYVTSSSFRADWLDITPEQYVKDHTLYVNIKQDQPTGLLLNETFYSEDVPTSDSNIDEGNNGTLDECCDNAGWTGSAVYLAAGGGLKLGSNKKVGYLTTPALDLSGSNGTVTVKFNARGYGSDESSVIVSCGEVSETIALTTEDADYTVVLNGVTAAEDQHITLSCIAVKKRFYLNSVQVYSGEVAQFKAASETGDANSRIITGITDQYYVVEISDVTALIDMLLGNEGAGCPICADVDGNHDVNISDVTALIDMLLTSN